MAKKTLDITIGADGSVKFEGSGFAGKECLAASREFERVIGGALASRTHKAEMNRTQTITNSGVNTNRG